MLSVIVRDSVIVLSLYGAMGCFLLPDTGSREALHIMGSGKRLADPSK